VPSLDGAQRSDHRDERALLYSSQQTLPFLQILLASAQNEQQNPEPKVQVSLDFKLEPLLEQVLI